MYEIVYTDTEKADRAVVDDMRLGIQPLDTKTTIFKSDGKVALVKSRLVAGVPAYRSEKRYYYWRTVTSLGFRTTTRGNVVPYHCGRAYDANPREPWKHTKPSAVFSILDNSLCLKESEAFKHYVNMTFDIYSSQDLYPMMKEYGIERYEAVPGTLLSGFRMDNIEEFTGRTFGKNRNTARMQAAVRNTEPIFVSIAQQARGLVDDEKLILFMENNKFDAEIEEKFSPFPTRLIRPVFRSAKRSTVEAVMSSQLGLDGLKALHRTNSMAAIGLPVGACALRSMVDRSGSVW